MNLHPGLGHNEISVRLVLLAEDARNALACVASGESTSLEGWIAYGRALNEGRALHAGDLEFGRWVFNNALSQLATAEVSRDDRAAAMWAAAFPDQFEYARGAGNARTVRGIYSKWQEIDAERSASEARVKADAERKRADAERAVAKERADAEAAALAAVKRAKDDAERKAANATVEREANARADAEKRAQAADTAARAADKAAKSADKKAARAKNGNFGTDKTAHVANNSGENEWYTPAPIIEAARRVLGSFTLDPASSETANRTVRADQIFTAEDDGLSQDWPVGSIFMNPPYAQPLMGQFASKFAEAIRRGSTGIVLVNNATETGWFQEIAAECSSICFPRGRIRFVDPQGNPGAPLQGQAIIYCGENVAAFEEAFSALGMVLRRG